MIASEGQNSSSDLIASNASGIRDRCAAFGEKHPRNGYASRHRPLTARGKIDRGGSRSGENSGGGDEVGMRRFRFVRDLIEYDRVSGENSPVGGRIANIDGDNGCPTLFKNAVEGFGTAEPIAVVGVSAESGDSLSAISADKRRSKQRAFSCGDNDTDNGGLHRANGGCLVRYRGDFDAVIEIGHRKERMKFSSVRK